MMSAAQKQLTQLVVVHFVQVQHLIHGLQGIAINWISSSNWDGDGNQFFLERESHS